MGPLRDRTLRSLRMRINILDSQMVIDDPFRYFGN